MGAEAPDLSVRRLAAVGGAGGGGLWAGAEWGVDLAVSWVDLEPDPLLVPGFSVLFPGTSSVWFVYIHNRQTGCNT